MPPKRQINFDFIDGLSAPAGGLVARINFEDSLFKKPGFQKLMIRLGDRHKAMGMVVDLWSLAQKYWFPDRKPIPIEAFQDAELSPVLVECGLAEGVDGGIYAKGAEDAFAWLFEAAEKGKKGGAARAASAERDEKGRLMPKTKAPKRKKTSRQSPDSVQQTLDDVQTESRQSQTSLLSSLSSSLLSLSSSSDLISQNSSSTVLATTAKPVLTALVEFESEKQVLGSIPDQTRERWMELYPDPEFLKREALKAFNWYDNNPRKKPKTVRGWCNAFSSWFERGWKYHVKTLQAAPGSTIDWAKVFSEPGGAA